MSESQSYHLLKKSLLIGLAVVSSRILGLIREQLILYYFGVNSELDAFYSAYRLPSLIRNLMGEGALSAVFVSMCTHIQKRNPLEAQTFTNQVFSFSLLLAFLTSFAIFVFAPFYLELFHRNPSTLGLGISFVRILALFIDFIIPAVIFMGVLHVHQNFFMPSIAPAIGNVINLILLITLKNKLGIYALPIAFLGNSFGMGLFLLIALIKKGIRFRFNFGFSKNIQSFLLNFIPVSLGMGFFQLNQLISNRYSSVIAGGTSTIEQSSLFIQMIIGILSTGMSFLFVPLFMKKSLTEQSKFLFDSLFTLLKLMLPFFLITFMLSSKIGLFMYYDLLNLFGLTETKLSREAIFGIAKIVRAFSPLIILYPLVSLLNRFFQALQRFYVPVWATLASSVLNIILIENLFSTYGLSGIAYSLVLSALLNFSLLMILSLRLIQMSFIRLVVELFFTFLALVPMYFWIARLERVNFLPNLFFLPLIGMGAILIYGFFIWLFFGKMFQRLSIKIEDKTKSKPR